MKSFQLVRGYLPGIAGPPSKTLTKYIIYPNVRIQRDQQGNQIARSQLHTILCHKPGDDIFVFYKSINKSFDVEWVIARVEVVKMHYMQCIRSTKGKPMRVANEQIRTIPNYKLSAEIAQISLEHKISNTGHSEIKTIN